MAARKSNEDGLATVGAIGGLFLVAVVGLKYGPAILKRLTASGSASPSGGGGSILNRILGKNPTQPTQPKQPAQPKQPSQPKGGSGGGGNGGGGSKGTSVADTVESVSQALMRGDYNGDTQSILAGIFNVQHGSGDFAGDSAESMGQSWLDSGWGLESLDSSLPSSIGGYESLETLNLDGTNIADSFDGDTSGDSWVNDLFGGSGSDPYVSDSDTSVDYGDGGGTSGGYGGGGNDGGDTGGGYDGGDTGGGYDGGYDGGDVSDYGPYEPDPPSGGGPGEGGDADGGTNYDSWQEDESEKDY